MHPSPFHADDQELVRRLNTAPPVDRDGARDELRRRGWAVSGNSTGVIHARPPLEPSWTVEPGPERDGSWVVREADGSLAPERYGSAAAAVNHRAQRD